MEEVVVEQPPRVKRKRWVRPPPIILRVEEASKSARNKLYRKVKAFTELMDLQNGGRWHG